jgi:hypothetical protein
MDGIRAQFEGAVSNTPRMGVSRSGQPFLRFNVRVSCRNGQHLVTTFLWGRLAEDMQGEIARGTYLQLDGSLQPNDYTNLEGHRVYGLTLSVSHEGLKVLARAGDIKLITPDEVEPDR